MQGISYLKAFTVPVKIDVALSAKRSVQLKSITSLQFTMCLAKVIEFGNYGAQTEDSVIKIHI